MAAKKKTPKLSNSVDATVFVPRGRVNRADILRFALMAVRDQIPLAAMNVKPEIVSASEVRTDDTGTEGRDYTVTVTWKPRRVGAEESETPEPGVDEVIEALAPLTVEQLGAATDTAQLA